VLGQTLEHLADPGRVFEAIKACLAPGGLLYIDVPNICYPTFWRLGRFLRAEHLFHYSPRTLRLTLRKHGFDPIEIEADLWLRTAARVGGRGAIDYAKEGDRWREIARLFPRRFLTVATLRGKAFIRSAVYGTLGYEGGQRLLTRLRGGAEAHRS
jgi:SAM-dependent methyltransferase